jgi:hypothetical protein
MLASSPLKKMRIQWEAKRSKGFALLDSLVAMLVGALLLTLFSLSLGGMTSALLKMRDQVDSFEQASQVFLLIRRDIADINSAKFQIKKIKISVDKSIAEGYPIETPLQILNQPPQIQGLDFFRYAGGKIIWVVHFLFPLKILSGKKGEETLKIENSEIKPRKYLSQAWNSGDIIGVWEGDSLQLLQISRVSPSQIFLTKPLKLSVNKGQGGLLVSDLWYLGYENKNKNKNLQEQKALYRNQNGINEKMVSNIDAFGVGQPWQIWVDQGKNHYVFS